MPRLKSERRIAAGLSAAVAGDAAMAHAVVPCATSSTSTRSLRTGFVARVYALRDVVLAELAANRAKPFHAIATDDAARISVHIEDSADAAPLNDGSELVVQVLFKVTAKQSEVAVVTVAGQFDLRYARQFDEGKVSEEDAKLFYTINGVYNAWPYMRELVANTFTRLG